jgi:hypothetical protein
VIKVEINDFLKSDEIYAFLSRFDSSLIYTTPRFLKLLQDHLRAEVKWLAAHQNSNLVGLLPYMIKTGPWGNVYNSLPYYGSNGAVICDVDHQEVKKSLIKEYFAIAEAESACSATIISNPLMQDSKIYDDFAPYTYKDVRIGQITHLPKTSESLRDDLLKIFDDPRPRNIRKAIKENVKVEKSRAKDDLDFLYETHKENMRAIGGKAKSAEFFQLIPKIMKSDDWCVYTATKDDKLIAALLTFYYGNTVEYFTPVIVEAFRPSQALALVCFEAMIDATSNGFTNWNWGGTWLSQGGVYDFKKRWGTSEYYYYYYTQIFNHQLMNKTREEILDAYPDFFVIPFGALNSGGKN